MERGDAPGTPRPSRAQTMTERTKEVLSRDFQVKLWHLMLAATAQAVVVVFFVAGIHFRVGQTEKDIVEMKVRMFNAETSVQQARERLPAIDEKLAGIHAAINDLKIELRRRP
jgi:hypothetical protein